MQTYRILSLDGGGSWSIIQIKALKRIFGDIPGREILGQFDLVAGNSGGSIVAAGLAENKRPSELENIFKNRATRDEIYSRLTFREINFLNRMTKWFGIGPRYSARRKYEALKRILPEVSKMPIYLLPPLMVGDRNTHFLIVAFDYHRNRSKFFRSDVYSKARTDIIARKAMGFDKPITQSDVTITQAIHSSSNAPLNYFDAPAQLFYEDDEGDTASGFWDGAIGGYNNPLLAAVVEAVSNDVQLENIEVLSIGTGSVTLPFEDTHPATHDWLHQKFQTPSFVDDVMKITTSILGDPPDAATFVSYTMMYPNLPLKQRRFIRINPSIQPVIDYKNDEKYWVIPDGFTSEQFKELLELDLDATTDEQVMLLEKLADMWLADAVPNQAIRADGYLNCLLGHPSFGAAFRDLEHWDLKRARV